MTQPSKEKTHTLLMEWYRRVILSQQAHFNAALYFQRLNYLLGVPVVILSGIVGTSIFSALETQPSTLVKILVGLTSILAAVLAGLQTFLRYAEQSEKHRNTGAHYGSLRRQIEQLLIYLPETDAEARETLDDVRKEQDRVGAEAPHIPTHIYVQTKNRYQEKFKGISFVRAAQDKS